MNSLELLSKTQIIREYNVPKHMIDSAIDKGELRDFSGAKYPGRYYIPREAVERWIRERTGLWIVESEDTR